MWYLVTSGFLDIEEISHVCKELGKNLSAQKLSDAMDVMDKDGSGEVSLKEFERWWRRELRAYIQAPGPSRFVRTVQACITTPIPLKAR